MPNFVQNNIYKNTLLKKIGHITRHKYKENKYKLMNYKEMAKMMISLVMIVVHKNLNQINKVLVSIPLMIYNILLLIMAIKPKEDRCKFKMMDIY